MNIPENLKYTKDHEWIKIQGDEAFVGITDFAQGELGDIVFVEIETRGFWNYRGSKNCIGYVDACKW